MRGSLAGDHERRLRGGESGMERCNELCTKEATGTCALCDPLTEGDRFWGWWFKGGVFIEGLRVLRQWWYPIPRTEVRHKDVVREIHKQCSETLNKTMLVLIGVAFFCLLTTLSSPDKLLLGADSVIKVPFADAPLSFLGFIVVGPLLLIVLTIYLHVFYGYWLECEWERQYLNKRLIPPIESVPTLFYFSDAVPYMLTWIIFYGLVPAVLVTITRKAWALPDMGLPLTWGSGGFIIVLVVLLCRRCSSNQRLWWTLLGFTTIILITGLMAFAYFNPPLFQRPLNLFRAELPKAWLVGANMRYAVAQYANLQDANLQSADLRWAALSGANLQSANLQQVKLQRAGLAGTDLRGAKLQQAELQGAIFMLAKLQQADLYDAKLQKAILLGADLQGASLREAKLQQAELQGARLQEAILVDAKLQGADLQGARLQGAKLQRANLHGANLRGTDLQGANLQGTDLQGTDLQGTNLQGTDLQGANLLLANLRGSIPFGVLPRVGDLWELDLTEVKGLTQDQVNMACVDENTKLPQGLTRPAPCPVYP
jgi:uncharacterized protein YjbI with pentapeptide repeats